MEKVLFHLKRASAADCCNPCSLMQGHICRRNTVPVGISEGKVKKQPFCDRNCDKKGKKGCEVIKMNLASFNLCRKRHEKRTDQPFQVGLRGWI